MPPRHSATHPLSTATDPQKPKIIVVVQGGVVTDIICDQPAEAVRIDYDTDGAEEADLTQIAQSEGDKETVAAFASGYQVKVNPVRVTQLFDAVVANGNQPVRVEPTGNPHAEAAVELGDRHFEKGHNGWFEWRGQGQAWEPATDAKLIACLEKAKGELPKPVNCKAIHRLPRKGQLA